MIGSDVTGREELTDSIDVPCCLAQVFEQRVETE